MASFNINVSSVCLSKYNNNSKFVCRNVADNAHQTDIIALCIDFMNFNQLAKLRMVSKLTSSMVSNENMWNIAATIQERRESKGKRVVLFNQYIMSRENAASLPLSHLYK